MHAFLACTDWSSTQEQALHGIMRFAAVAKSRTTGAFGDSADGPVLDSDVSVDEFDPLCSVLFGSS